MGRLVGSLVTRVGALEGAEEEGANEGATEGESEMSKHRNGSSSKSSRVAYVAVRKRLVAEHKRW
jgi:hypothetical protein